MIISAIKFPHIKSIAFKQDNNAKQFDAKFPTNNDSFERTTPITEKKEVLQGNISKSDIDNIFLEYSRAEVNQIFDETYPVVTKFNFLNNPILKELKIERPTIKIEDFLNSNMRACYSFIENTITISQSMVEEDIFLLFKRDDKTKKMKTFGFYPESSLETEKEKLKEEGNLEAIKLTEEEKEFYIRSLFAHEIRHMFQSHLVASTLGCLEPYKNAITPQVDMITILKEQVKKAYKEIEDSIAKAKADGEEIAPEVYEMLEDHKPDEDKDYSYGLEYTPSKVLPSDSKLKFSVLIGDKRELSVKEDLLPAEISKLVEGNNYHALNYTCNLLEIDAFNHAFEYILSYFPSDKTNMRREVLNSMAIESRKNSELGIDLLELLNKLPEGMKT